MGTPSVRLAVTIFVLAYICCLNSVAVALMHPRPKTIRITHYSHEIRGGPNSTFLLAAGTPQPDLGVGAAFGSFIVYDNVMRTGASPDSPRIGRISGTAIGVVRPITTANNRTRVQLKMNHIYEEGSPYDGSVVNVDGIFYFPPPWEMRIIGATGKLRGYTGYGFCRPISQTTGDPPVFLVYQWDFYLTRTEEYF